MKPKEELPPIGVDINVLIYALRSDETIAAITDRERRSRERQWQRAAKRLLDRTRQDGRDILLTAISLGEY